MTSAPDAAARTTGASVIRGGLWTTASHLLPQFYVLVISVAAARFLGAADFGRQSFIAFVGISAAMLLSTGLSVALMRAVAELFGRGRPEQARGLTRWGWETALAAGALGGGAVAAAGLLGADPEAAWVLAGVRTVLAILHTVPNAALIGMQRFREAAQVGVVAGAIAVPATIGVLAAGGGIAGMFAVDAAVTGLTLAWTTALARRGLRAAAPEPAPPSRPLRASAARFAGWTTLSAVLVIVVWRRSEFFFLAAFSTDTEIALYSVAFAAVTALSVLPEQLAAVVGPAFATLRGAAAADRIRSGYGHGLRLLLLLTLPLAAGAAIVGPEAVRVVYGDEFDATEPVIMVLALVLPFLAVWSITNALMTGLENAKLPLAASAAAAAVNVALAFALVPSHDAVGAAAANVGGQITAAVLLFALARRDAGAGHWRAGPLLRALAATAGCAMVSWAALEVASGLAGVLLATLAGGAAFLALALALRILPGDDADWLDRELGHVLGGRVGRLARLAGHRRREVTA